MIKKIKDNIEKDEKKLQKSMKEVEKFGKIQALTQRIRHIL